jgi:chromate transporter
LQLPDIGSVDFLALCLTVVAFVLLFRTKLGVLGTLAICGVAAIAAQLVSL